MRVLILLKPLSLWVSKNETPEWVDKILTFILENKEHFPLDKLEGVKGKNVCIDCDSWDRIKAFNNINFSLRVFCMRIKAEGFHQIVHSTEEDC